MDESRAVDAAEEVRPRQVQGGANFHRAGLLEVLALEHVGVCLTRRADAQQHGAEDRGEGASDHGAIHD